MQRYETTAKFARRQNRAIDSMVAAMQRACDVRRLTTLRRPDLFASVPANQAAV